ncbi:MAG: alanine racemase, partial [Cyanobacteria bacterium P01_F01_bin.150]
METTRTKTAVTKAAATSPDTVESAWCEVSQSAINANINVLRRRIGPDVNLGVVVKADGFGHGIVPCAKAFLTAGADWLIVNFAYEAVTLRDAGIEAPIYICGNVPAAQAHRVVETRSRLILYDAQVAKALSEAAQGSTWSVPVHIKIETGTHRQGLTVDDAIQLAKTIKTLDGVSLEGIATHYADIEDTTDHRFAHQQLTRLKAAKQEFQAVGIDIPMMHSANSAATILWPQTHGNLVRVGLAAYGLWPSPETYTTVLQTALTQASAPQTSPVPLEQTVSQTLEKGGDWGDRTPELLQLEQQNLFSSDYFIPHLSPVLS